LTAHFAAFSSYFSVERSTALSLYGFAALFTNILVERRPVSIFDGFATLFARLASEIGIGGKSTLFVMIVGATMGLRNLLSAFRPCNRSWFRHP
jgi:hypothetical protein